MTDLINFVIPRCYKPPGFRKLKKAELHLFLDVSLKEEDENDKIHCSFIMGKAKVTPLKCVTVPRLELTAAVVSG